MSRETEDLLRDIVNGINDGRPLPPLPDGPPPQDMLHRGPSSSAGSQQRRHQGGDYHTATPRRGSDGVRPRLPSPTKRIDTLPPPSTNARGFVPGNAPAGSSFPPTPLGGAGPSHLGATGASPNHSPRRVPGAAPSPLGGVAYASAAPAEAPRRIDRSHIRTPVTVVTDSKDTGLRAFQADPNEFRAAAPQSGLQVTQVETTNPSLYLRPGTAAPVAPAGRGRPVTALDPRSAYQSALRQRRIKPSEDASRDRSPVKGAHPTSIPGNIYDREWHRDPYIGINAGRSPYDSVHSLKPWGAGQVVDRAVTVHTNYDTGPLPEEFEEALQLIHQKRQTEEADPEPGLLRMGHHLAQYRKTYKNSVGNVGEARNSMRQGVLDVPTLVDQLQLQPAQDGDRSFVVTGDFLIDYTGDREPVPEQSDDSSVYDEEENIPLTQYHEDLMVFREQMLYYRRRHPEEYPKYLDEVLVSGLPREHHEYFRREKSEIDKCGGMVPELAEKRRREIARRERAAMYPEPCLEEGCRSRFRNHADMMVHAAVEHPKLAKHLRKVQKEREKEEERERREQEKKSAKKAKKEKEELKKEKEREKKEREKEKAKKKASEKKPSKKSPVSPGTPPGAKSPKTPKSPKKPGSKKSPDKKGSPKAKKGGAAAAPPPATKPPPTKRKSIKGTL